MLPSTSFFQRQSSKISSPVARVRRESAEDFVRLLPGSSLPCHTVSYDETSTIVRGSGHLYCGGKKYSLSDEATIFVPEGVPRQLVNERSETVELIWVYAGKEPERSVIDPEFCASK